MRTYYIEQLNIEGFHTLLNGMLPVCDSFYIIEPHVATNLIGVVDEPLLKKLLKKWWIGTVTKPCQDPLDLPENTEDQEISEIQDRYICCKESIQILHKYNSFFSQEADLDVMNLLFYKGNDCILYTIGGEKMIVVNMDIMEDIVNSLKCDKWEFKADLSTIL